jgi:nuclear transport factor 2 (NTF2) superfamily protein
MDETQRKSPKVCFSEDSYLIYGIRRDSSVTKIGGESVARVFARSASDDLPSLVPTAVADRLLHWPLGPRPADHKGLSELGL